MNFITRVIGRIGNRLTFRADSKHGIDKQTYVYFGNLFRETRAWYKTWEVTRTEIKQQFKRGITVREGYALLKMTTVFGVVVYTIGYFVSANMGYYEIKDYIRKEEHIQQHLQHKKEDSHGHGGHGH